MLHLKRRCKVPSTAVGSSIWPSARTRLQASDPKIEPNLPILAVLRSVDLICHLWQQYVNIALFPLASSSVVVRREMAVFNNQTVSRIEGAANNVMQLLIDGEAIHWTCFHYLSITISAIVFWLRTQLEKQKRLDFKPKNDDEAFARVNTEPCTICCDFLEKVRDAARQHLSGKNLEIFLTEIGVAFNG
jgi:exocyst complex component 5